MGELCARLDYLPLALELAAARTKLLSPEALLERLEARLDLLKGTRDADERHATLRATMAWSYDLLDAREQQLFRRLAVFRAGCTLESAELVCDADLDTLASLLDKSLLRRRTGRLGDERFWMLETIREFALEQLEASGEAEELRRRHAERMLEMARSAHLTENDDERFRLPLVLADEPDMRAAVDWASGADLDLALELVVALENFWNVHAHREVIRRLNDLLPRATTASPWLRANALRVLGGALHVNGDLEECDESYRESLTLYRQLEDERGIASLLQRLAASAFLRNELDTARALLDQSQELAAGRHPYIEIANVTVLGRVAVASGDVEHGVGLLRRSLEMAQAVDWHWWQAGTHASLALVAANRGELDDAERNSLDALHLIREDDSRPGTILPLVVLARVALARGDLRRAGLMWGAVEAEMSRSPHPKWTRVRADRGGPLLAETDPGFLSAVEDGRALDLWDAVAIASGEEGTSQSAHVA